MKSPRAKSHDRGGRRLRTTSHERRVTIQEIRVKNALAELERVSGIVERFGAEHGIPTKAVFEINLALDEVLTNVITHGYQGSGNHEISVRLSVADGALAVTIEDDGPSFNPLAVSAPQLHGSAEARPTGGLGIHFVRQLMDQLQYTRQANRNILVMTKHTGAGARTTRGG